ncbi:hypothetical protein D6789_04145 [Candidatus Woesearchaeota archaeon]|nr:MAG: hypothetical protein D6789_04145 [Candidatus Woesearchaeota archaeon]
MVDFQERIEQLPPRERLRRLRAEEEKRRKELEEELARKRRELEELEKKKAREEEELEELEEETLEDIAEHERESIAELERQIAAFKRKEAGEPSGGGSHEEDYTEFHALLQQAQQGVDYLLHAPGITEERRREVERDLYTTMNTIRDQAQEQHIDEAYAFNQLRENMMKLKEADDFYVQRMQKALNDILQYTP